MASKVKKSVPGMSKKARVDFLEAELKRLRAELAEAKAVNRTLDSQLAGYTASAVTIDSLTKAGEHLKTALAAHAGLHSFAEVVMNAADRGHTLEPEAIRLIRASSKDGGDSKDRGSKLAILTDGTIGGTRVYTLGKGLEQVGMISALQLTVDVDKLDLSVTLPKTNEADSVTSMKLARVRTLLLTVPNLSVKV